MQGFAIVWLVGLVSRAYFIREGRDLPLLFGTGIYRGSVVSTQCVIVCTVSCLARGSTHDAMRSTSVRLFVMNVSMEKHPC